MLVAINDMSISDCISAEFLAQHQEFIRGAKVIVADCNLSEEALVWVLENSGETPVFIDPVSAWKCVKIRDHLSKIHTLKPNRLEAETLSGIALSGREDVAKVAARFHQHGLNRPVLSMGGMAFTTVISTVKVGGRPLLKRMSSMLLGQATP